MAAMPDRDSQTDSAPSDGGTSLSLLARAVQREAAAWERLVGLYSPLVFFWCRRSGLGPDDSADVLQNVWQAVAGHLARFERQSDGAFRGWLWTITRNKLHDHFRRQQRQPAGAGGSTAQQLMSGIPEQEPESYLSASLADGSGDLLGRALEQIRHDFEPNSWQAFWLSAVEGQAARAIAERLQMSLDAVYQAKARILRRLREELAGLQDQLLK